MNALDLPDEPRWVEAHGIAADAASWRRDNIVVSDRARLAVVVGEAEPSSVLAIASELPAYSLLVVTDDLAAALRGAGRSVDRAILHTLPDVDALPEYEGATLLPADANLAHAPAALVDELRGHRVWTAYVDGAPVAFAYAPWRSARWFDISVDTLAGSRQLGLATIVAAAMIRDERARGREPVWGADEGNHASLRLAKRLGFEAVDEIWVASPQ